MSKGWVFSRAEIEAYLKELLEQHSLYFFTEAGYGGELLQEGDHIELADHLMRVRGSRIDLSTDSTYIGSIWLTTTCNKRRRPQCFIEIQDYSPCLEHLIPERDLQLAS